MAEFKCIRPCFWGLKRWELGMKLVDVPEEKVGSVPHHFERLDKPKPAKEKEEVKAEEETKPAEAKPEADVKRGPGRPRLSDG